MRGALPSIQPVSVSYRFGLNRLSIRPNLEPSFDGGDRRHLRTRQLSRQRRRKDFICVSYQQADTQRSGYHRCAKHACQPADLGFLLQGRIAMTAFAPLLMASRTAAASVR